MSFADENAAPVKRDDMTPAHSRNPTAMEATIGEKPEVKKLEPETPRRIDTIGSAKWHDTAMEAHPDNHFFTSAKGDHLSITNALDMLDSVNKTRDPRVTDAAHAEKLTKQAEQAAQRITDRIPKTLQRSADAIRNHQKVMDDALKISMDSDHGREIRERLSRMSDDDRRNAIHQAAADGDHHVMAAVIHGPGFLTGISEADKAKFKDHYARRHAPQLVKELESMQRSADKLEAAHFDAVDHINRHYVNRKADPDVQRATEAQKRYDDVLRNL
ncbi:hypothetical protein [Halomonas sp. Mc5H-6]|uniref:hypothetical protein n=1 Tax=Halomonas sp. Mc5H-6 TaxID=2954500 RepID=UPI002096B07B|nr:hypothetical protein [Halomonas sp. Mc5H-6]MCO7245256.1 hypothetical protein [Halomonas sp. Mc5H-6]